VFETPYPRTTSLLFSSVLSSLRSLWPRGFLFFLNHSNGLAQLVSYVFRRFVGFLRPRLWLVSPWSPVPRTWLPPVKGCSFFEATLLDRQGLNRVVMQGFPSLADMLFAVFLWFTQKLAPSFLYRRSRAVRCPAQECAVENGPQAFPVVVAGRSLSLRFSFRRPVIVCILEIARRKAHWQKVPGRGEVFFSLSICSLLGSFSVFSRTGC